MNQSESEFDQIFAVMDAPDYPSTCNGCGEEGTNATMQFHECERCATCLHGRRWHLNDDKCQDACHCQKWISLASQSVYGTDSKAVCFPPLNGGGTGAQSEHVFDNTGQCVRLRRENNRRRRPDITQGFRV